MNEQLRKYIKNMLKEGSTEEQIVEALKEGGWDEEQIKIEITKVKRVGERKLEENKPEPKEKKCVSYFTAFVLVGVGAAAYWTVDNFDMISEIVRDILLAR